MNFSDETVMAYADGELDAASRAAVEAAMATDPQLAQRVARHRALRERLRAALRPVLDEPLPERLLEGVRGAPAPRHAANVVALKRNAAPQHEMGGCSEYAPLPIQQGCISHRGTPQ